MHKEGSQTDLGNIKIHKNVIASIASIAALEIEGVKRIAGNFGSRLLELIGKNSLIAIKVGIDKNDEVKVDVPLVIKYGYNIPDIANKVQENIRVALEKMTNLSIKYINVNVQSIERG